MSICTDQFEDGSWTFLHSEINWCNREPTAIFGHGYLLGFLYVVVDCFMLMLHTYGFSIGAFNFPLTINFFQHLQQMSHIIIISLTFDSLLGSH